MKDILQGVKQMQDKGRPGIAFPRTDLGMEHCKGENHRLGELGAKYVIGCKLSALTDTI
jgi:hypothetical protein